MMCKQDWFRQALMRGLDYLVVGSAITTVMAAMGIAWTSGMLSRQLIRTPPTTYGWMKVDAELDTVTAYAGIVVLAHLALCLVYAVLRRTRRIAPIVMDCGAMSVVVAVWVVSVPNLAGSWTVLGDASFGYYDFFNFALRYANIFTDEGTVREIGGGIAAVAFHVLIAFAAMALYVSTAIRALKPSRPVRIA